ncbi:MAG: GNAT family N-acetyltransferase [Bacteroidia bacterium]
MNLNFKVRPFAELSLKELYEILALRQSIFIVEQNCPYMDCDGKDFHALHLMGFTDEGKLAAYARIIEPGISYPEVSIGRVVTATTYRKFGLGRQLMAEALRVAKENYGDVDVRIGAQRYLLKFYADFGFETGEPYIEDGIDHNIMLRKGIST